MEQNSLTRGNCSNFDCLPAEMKFMILEALDIESQKMSRLVCKEWKQLIDKRMKFSGVLCDSTSHNISKFDSKHMNTLVVVNTKNYLPLSLKRQESLPDPENLVFGIGVSSENMIKLLRYKGQFIRSLTFDHMSLVEYSSCNFRRISPQLNLSLLKELKFTVMSGGVKLKYHLKGITQVLKFLIAPSVEKIHVEMNIMFGQTDHDRVLNKESIEFFNRIQLAFRGFALRHRKETTTRFEVKREFYEELNFNNLTQVMIFY